MQRFKKRIRLLVNELNGVIDYGRDDSIEVRFESGSVGFTSTSFETMTCKIDLGDGPRTFPLPKTLCFDIVDRLASSHLARTLRDYRKPTILQLDDYINDENGASPLWSLQQELEKNPELVRKELGGNRILAAYYRGVLILRDDLVMAGTNVIEFDAASPIIRKAT